MGRSCPAANTPGSGSTAAPALDLRRRLRRRLHAWFVRHRRDLPWRADRDPYRIWVSEVMLQQTQVATVVPYFNRFVAALPTVAALAAADEQQVLRLWEGLGYYRRARDLHRAARMLAGRHGAAVPDDPAAFGALPGVGRYIRGAVLSQAFGRRLPILEANSERVLCRLFGLEGDPRTGPVRQRLWHLAEALLPARHVGDFNQALMELGALVCTPQAPRCGRCPVAADCVARRLGAQDRIPAKAPRPEPVATAEVGVVAWRGRRVFLVRRPDRGRWAGMWEFPHGPVAAGEPPEAAGPRVLAELTGLRADLGPELLTVRHAVNHHQITLACFEARHRGGSFRSDVYVEGRWVEPAELAAYPVSVPQRRLARALLGTRQRRLF